MRNTQQRCQKRVPPGLRQNALGGVNQNDRHICGRCAGDHIAGVLFVPGRIRDNKLSVLGTKKSVGHVNGNALLAFSGQAIY